MSPRPYYEDAAVKLYHGDCRDILPSLEPAETCVTDPPYGLKFMGKGWDHGVPGVEFWTLVRDALLPGASLMAFGGTRTFHRLTCAIEDAGFEVRDCLMWLYGSGFPKSLDVAKALDKAAGAEREATATGRTGGGRIAMNDAPGNGRARDYLAGDYNITAPATDAARQWNGWGTALKPAHETIVGAQKPHEWQSVIGISALKIMEALRRLPSYAKGAGLLSLLSQNERGEECDSALWDAVERCSTPGALSDLMATWPSESEMPLSLSIACSWLNTLGALLKHGSRFTTETATSLTTDLRILNCSQSALTPAIIIRDAISLRGTGSSVSLADSTFSAAAARLRLILARSAHESATGPEPTEPLDAIGELSPAWEPIVLAMKPLDGTFAENALRHGVAGLNIDGARIGTDDDLNGGAYSGDERRRAQYSSVDSTPGAVPLSRLSRGIGEYKAPSGRWPANLLLDEEAARLLDEQSGTLSVTGARSERSRGAVVEGTAWGTRNHKSTEYPNDSGGASRFFYTAKASRSERGPGNTHPTVKPLDLLMYLCTLTATPTGGTVLDPFCGSGSTLIAAIRQGRKAIGIELSEEYCEIAVRRIKDEPIILPFGGVP